jgi:hypothetical protein
MSADRYARVAIECLDEIAMAMERKWGIGRLPRLVDPALAAKFDAQREKLNDALASERHDAIAAQAAAMERAWKALDAAAIAAGAKPLSPTVWETALPSTGEIVAIVRTAEEASAVAHERNGAVYTLAEVAVAIDAIHDDIRAVKQTFPGAAVKAVRHRELGIGSGPIEYEGQSRRSRYAINRGRRPPRPKPAPVSILDGFDDDIPF